MKKASKIPPITPELAKEYLSNSYLIVKKDEAIRAIMTYDAFLNTYEVGSITQDQFHKRHSDYVVPLYGCWANYDAVFAVYLLQRGKIEQVLEIINNRE